MRKIIPLLLILLFTAHLKNIYAQVPDWSRVLQTSTFGFQSADVVTADAGNVFMAAGISGPISFEGSSFNTLGLRDMIISKINTTGITLWTKQFNAGIDGSIFPNAIITDAAGNIFVSCAFTGMVTIGSSTVFSDLTINSFYAKFDSNGNGIWATAFSSNGNGGSKIALDAGGNSYLIGRSSKLLKFNSTGTILWEQSYVTQTLQALAIYGTNLYLGGTLQSPSTTFGSITLNSLGGYNTGFLLKGNLNGLYTSSMVVGGSTTQDGSSVSQIIIDSSGNLIITGAYTENLFLGSSTINNVAGTGMNYTYIAKCNNAFSFFWAVSSTQYLNINREMRNYRLFLDNLNNIYEYGSIGSSFQFGSVPVNPADGQFLVKFDVNGNATDAFALENTSPNKVFVTPEGKILTVGSYNYPGAPNYGNLYLNQYFGNMSLEWQKIGAGVIESGSVTVKYVKHDSSGNTYIQARVIGYCDFFGNIINSSNYVTVISKLDIDGNLLWMNQIPDLEPSLFGPDFSLDKDNNVFTVGLFKTSLIIDTTALSSVNAGNEAYVAKFNSNGVLLWASKMNLGADVSPNITIAPDYDGNVVVSGVIAPSNYMVKFDPFGIKLWEKIFPMESYYLSLVSTDTSNNIYLTSEIHLSDGTGTATIGSVTLNQTYNEGATALIKFDQDGNTIWAKTYGGKSGATFSDGWPVDIKTDASGNTFLWGWCVNSALFDTYTLTNPIGTGYSLFITKINPSGNVIWAKAVYEKTQGFNYGDLLDIDNTGNIYVGGHFRDEISIDGAQYFPEGSNDFFVGKFSGSGVFQWIKTIPAGGNIINSLSVYKNDVLSFGGSSGLNSSIGSFSLLKKGGSLAIIPTLGSLHPQILSTYNAGNISLTMATSGGSISTDGGSAIISRGVCWSYSPNPTISDSKTLDGSGIGSFASILNGLIPGKKYFVRSYASNGVGTAYGNEISFTTPGNDPSVLKFSLIGTGFFKSDGTTPANWDFDIDLSYTGTSGNVSSYKLNNQQILTGGEFKIRKDHMWNESYGYNEMPIFGDTPNFTMAFPNFKTTTGKIYDLTFMVNWVENTYALIMDDSSQFILTTPVYAVASDSAVSGGEVYNEGLYPVISRGVCWNTAPNPTLSNQKTDDGPGIGTFKSSLTGLNSNTTYYIRSYATNIMGTFYGNQMKFTTAAACQSDFVYNFDPLTTYLTFNSLSQNATDYYWDFGDGNFSFLSDPVYAYAKPGSYTVCLTIKNSLTGCQSNSCMDIVYAPGNEKFILADYSFIADTLGLDVIFNDLSSPNTTEWYWTMGDGKILKTKSPVYTYSKPGVYTVCLTAIDKANLLLHTVCKEVTVGEIACLIKSDFNFFINPAELEVAFLNKSIGFATDYFWTFGDGSSSTHKNAGHKYSKPGFYLVSLSVRNSLSKCMDLFAQFIQVGSVDCRADFIFGVDPLTNTVNFKDESKGQIDYYYWDFGDGSFSVQPNPDKLYKKEGIYLVGQTVIDNTNGCIDLYVQPVQVGEVDCSADFVSYIDSSTNTGYFTNRNLGIATALLWSFGDGKFSTMENPVHAFQKGGIYTVGLNTFNLNTDCMDYIEESVLIGGLGDDCEADFIYRVDPANPEVIFSNKSIGEITGYLWNFGDQSDNSDEMDPVHSYSKGGYYNVCLSVINTSGIRNMSCKWVLVSGTTTNDCRANFMYTIDSANLEVKFVDNSFGSIDKYSWDFGDSKSDSISILQSPGHSYDQKGYYLVHLKIENTVSGCESNEYKLLNVAESQVLKAAFGYEAQVPDKKFAGYPVDLVSASSGDGATVEWDFGDKQLKKGAVNFTVMDSTSRIVTHYYQNPGKYEVCLRISDPVTGKSDVYCSFVYTKNAVGVDEVNMADLTLDVYPNPFVDFTTIKFALPESQFVEIAIFDQLGRKIDTLVKTRIDSGIHQMIWETKSHATGVYHLKLITSDRIITKQLVITR